MIIVDQYRIWLYKIQLICFWCFENYSPNRVISQFGYLSQHILDPVVPINKKIGRWGELINEALNLWNTRHAYMVIECNPPISLDKYEYWYWQMTRYFILKQSSKRLFAYSPQAPLECNVFGDLEFINVCLHHTKKHS